MAWTGLPALRRQSFHLRLLRSLVVNAQSQNSAGRTMSVRPTSGALRFLRGTDQYFADKRLRRLGNQHFNHVRDVVWLKHLLLALALVGLKSVLVDPGHTTDTRMLFARSSSASE